MKVLNVHKRVINQPKQEVSKLLETLASKQDKIWPFEKWPAIRFDKELSEGARGGHGIVRYSIEKYIKGELIQFKFHRPKGFNGVHRLEFIDLPQQKTEVKHTIEMAIEGTGILTWTLIIRPLHNALLEDALDKVENHFTEETKETSWSLWVRLLRAIFKSKKMAKK